MGTTSKKRAGIVPAIAAIVEELARNGFAFRSGDEMRSILGTESLESWPAFASSWNDLGPDRYMADGGRYRRRRFAAFESARGAVARKPHQAHYQSRDYNPLNGGIERWFMPVSDDVCTNAFLQGSIGVCLAVVGAASSGRGEETAWHAEMHQFRIEASQDVSAMPTPEGAHRDGVDWVCVTLVNRRNLTSGVTQIFDPQGRSLGEFTLTHPLDTMFLDDQRVLHGVTPIAPVDPASEAFRDVLVLTFRQDASTP